MPARHWTGQRSGPFDTGARDGRWRQDLRSVVAHHVVPHLLSQPGCRDAPGRGFAPERVAAVAAIAIRSTPDAAATAMEDALVGGATLESVFLDLLAPAARYLGDLWLADELSFVEVTRGTAVLQALLRRFGPAFEDEPAATCAGRSVFLMPVPGEQHLFGLSMLAAFFRRDGWRVAFEPAIDAAGAAARLAAEPFDLVGVSAAGDRAVARLPTLLNTLRDAAGGAVPPILVGGPAFQASTMRAAEVGADAIAGDAPGALRWAASLVAARPSAVRA